MSEFKRIPVLTTHHSTKIRDCYSPSKSIIPASPGVLQDKPVGLLAYRSPACVLKTVLFPRERRETEPQRRREVRGR
jgi:hypothetical protein